jgi:hypothetical protein
MAEKEVSSRLIICPGGSYAIAGGAPTGTVALSGWAATSVQTSYANKLNIRQLDTVPTGLQGSGLPEQSTGYLNTYLNSGDPI